MRGVDLRDPTTSSDHSMEYTLVLHYEGKKQLFAWVSNSFTLESGDLYLLKAFCSFSQGGACSKSSKFLIQSQIWITTCSTVLLSMLSRSHALCGSVLQKLTRFHAVIDSISCGNQLDFHAVIDSSFMQ